MYINITTFTTTVFYNYVHTWSQYHVLFFKTLYTFIISVDYVNQTVDYFALLKYKMHSVTTSSEIQTQSMFTTGKTMYN